MAIYRLGKNTTIDLIRFFPLVKVYRRDPTGKRGKKRGNLVLDKA